MRDGRSPIAVRLNAAPLSVTSEKMPDQSITTVAAANWLINSFRT